MKTGPKRKPVNLKVLDGTYRPHRDGELEAAPAVLLTAQCPPPPEALGEHGAATWLEHVPQMIAAGYFSDIDKRAFERFCRAHDEVHKCDLLLEEEGEYFVAESGYVGQHPAVNQRFKWLDIIRRYEEAFWLHPTARSGKQVNKRKSGVASRRRA